MKIIRVTMVLFSVIAFQCTHHTVQGDPASLEIIHAGYADLPSAEFQKEIKRLRERTEKALDASVAGETHLQLAFLLSHDRNPGPDYPGALRELETYMSLHPEGSGTASLRYWVRLLQEIKRLNLSNVKLTDGKEECQTEVTRISGENKAMSEKLKQIKNLDIQLEEKRKLAK